MRGLVMYSSDRIAEGRQTMPLQPLDTYDISADRGFLCQYDAATVDLPGEWARARTVAMQLPQLLTTGRVRHLLENRLPNLTEKEVEQLSETQARAASHWRQRYCLKNLPDRFAPSRIF